MEEHHESSNVRTFDGQEVRVVIRKRPGRPPKQVIPPKTQNMGDVYQFPLNEKPPKTCGACGYEDVIEKWSSLYFDGIRPICSMFILNPGVRVDIGRVTLYACPVCGTVTWYT
jgi:hypothetical protein